ncbi:thioesterase II family protein [Streptomyces hainanensis]|uniref:Thioesterase n=1 Tax=Streptomyces hainanensis TaxID=402648 RepID=A0A4R4T3E2_9ACTN|nr:alpha/beta fold hydrolase [Streptomyces hainanensis]TDC71418.1 thioesterase [Streptomyces hainanensis]
MTAPDGGRDTWIRRLGQEVPAAPRLVAFPHAGGSANTFLPLARTLWPGMEVFGVQYPGRQDRRAEELIDNVPEYARQVFRRLVSWTGRPLVLFGHSMGAVIAFEVARRLEQLGDVQLAGLVVSGRRAPSVTRDDDDVHLRDDRGLIAEIQSLDGTDAAFLRDDELLRMILPVVRSDYKAIETYRFQPGPKLRCPVTALVGDTDPKAGVDETTAWGDHTTGPFHFRCFPGGHFYVNACVQDVGKEIASLVSPW